MSTPAIHIHDLSKTYVVTERESGVMASLRSLVHRESEEVPAVDAIRLRFGWRPVTKEREVIPVWRAVWSPEVAITEWTSNPIIFERGKLKEVPQFSGIEDYSFLIRWAL
jgi:saccharopine dehydrogenase-like NADP-dependent oxidoreductase